MTQNCHIIYPKITQKGRFLRRVCSGAGLNLFPKRGFKKKKHLFYDRSQPVIETVLQMSNCISQNFSPFLLNLTLPCPSCSAPSWPSQAFQVCARSLALIPFWKKSLPCLSISQVPFSSSQTLSRVYQFSVTSSFSVPS